MKKIVSNNLPSSKSPVSSQSSQYSDVLRRLPTVALIAFWVSACAQGEAVLGGDPPAASSAEAELAQQQTRFPDVPLPSGVKMNTEKTLVFGGPTWFGQLALNSNNSANASFDFFKTQLPAYGWQEITSVRAPTSVLTYDRDDRVLQVLITKGRFIGSEIVLTVSPREGLTNNGNSPAYSPATGPTNQVQSRPLIQPAPDLPPPPGQN